ncbi:alpha/beta hydrolase [Demequina sp. SYSU T00192]|uniref:Alpha/beta hydrolase n=1 Tax=Demequina litoralis TaxID=3051660 RepID=A0ABT8G981_9MICO|nr:alpha/beta hydrolase [Demequina sp. SYSU T00192]MDN4475509.1 alpha/beta hydrolase [Demequina sp. SYSU T00192]
MQRRTPSGDPTDEPWAEPLASSALPRPLVEDDVATISGAVYASRPGYRPLELDLYAPADAWADGGLAEQGRRLPAIVWIHGGAFMLGSRRLLPTFLEEADFFAALARAGFVVATIDYRLSSEARWPAQLLDVRAAVRWLRSRADELGIATHAIAVWGESAGGHLAACAGLRGDATHPDEAPGIPLPSVAAVVDWYGPTDFAAMDRQAPPDALQVHDAPDSPESRLVGAPVQDAHGPVSDADPATHVAPGCPPVLIRHGVRDRLVPFGQSIHLAAALEAAGADVRLRPVEGAGHVFEGHPHPVDFVHEAVDFLREVMPSALSHPTSRTHR